AGFSFLSDVSDSNHYDYGLKHRLQTCFRVGKEQAGQSVIAVITRAGVRAVHLLRKERSGAEDHDYVDATDKATSNSTNYPTFFYALRCGPVFSLSNSFPVKDGSGSTRSADKSSLLSCAHIPNRGIFVLCSPSFRLGAELLQIPFTEKQILDSLRIVDGNAEGSNRLIPVSFSTSTAASSSSGSGALSAAPPEISTRWRIISRGLRTCKNTPLVPIVAKRNPQNDKPDWRDRLMLPGGSGFHPDSSDVGEELIEAQVVRLGRASKNRRR
ncbi:unnamed protein product, partial [Amoebophrya sp. A25]